MTNKNNVAKSMTNKDDVNKSMIDKDDVNKSMTNKDDVAKSMTNKNGVAKSMTSKYNVAKSMKNKIDVAESMTNKEDMAKIMTNKDDVNKTIIEFQQAENIVLNALMEVAEQIRCRSQQIVEVVAPQYGTIIHKSVSDAKKCDESQNSWLDGFGSLFQQQELIVDKILTEAISKVLENMNKFKDS